MILNQFVLHRFASSSVLDVTSHCQNQPDDRERNRNRLPPEFWLFCRRVECWRGRQDGRWFRALRRLDNFFVTGNRLPFAGAVIGTTKRNSGDAASVEHRTNLLWLKRPILLSINPKKQFHNFVYGGSHDSNALCPVRPTQTDFSNGVVIVVIGFDRRVA